MPLGPPELFVAGDEPPLRPKQIEAAVDDDPVQPGTEGATLVEARQRRKRALKCILGDVVRELASSRNHVRRAPGSPPMAGEEPPPPPPPGAARGPAQPRGAAHAPVPIVLIADVLFASPTT